MKHLFQLQEYQRLFRNLQNLMLLFLILKHPYSLIYIFIKSFDLFYEANEDNLLIIFIPNQM